MFPNYTLFIMDKLTFNVSKVEESRIMVEVMYMGEISLGILYFEKPKAGWTNKPIMPKKWRCVDAKVEGLYERDSAITPKDIVGLCQEEILRLGY